MQFIDKVAILGAGESGISAALLAKQKGFEVFVSDGNCIKDSFKKELLKNNIPFEERKYTLKTIIEADWVIKSPGIPQDISIIQSIRKKAIPILSEVEWAFQFYKGKIIAITGTNGKTTTSLLLYHILKYANFSVTLGGNIGESFSRKLLKNSITDYIVLEISSFQLEDIFTFKPNIAVILNITPDHLNRYHFQMKKYIATKFKLIQNMTSEDLLIYNSKDTHIANWLHDNPIPFSSLSCSSFLRKKIFLFVYFFNKFPIVFKHLPLLGKCNALNTTAAIQVAMYLGIEKRIIQQALMKFRSISHRLQSVRKWNNIHFINDSKATNVEAVLCALNSFSNPIIWIAGGIDKGNNYNGLLDIAKRRIKVLICLGKETRKLQRFFNSKIPQIYTMQKMDKVVKLASRIASPNDVVLLSPACASFDLFTDYKERGNAFIKSVRNLP